jgi:hypothetical protein
MTVAELMRMLKKLNPNEQVWLATTYRANGDSVDRLEFDPVYVEVDERKVCIMMNNCRLVEQEPMDKQD